MYVDLPTLFMLTCTLCLCLSTHFAYLQTLFVVYVDLQTLFMFTCTLCLCLSTHFAYLQTLFVVYVDLQTLFMFIYTLCLPADFADRVASDVQTCHCH